MKFQTHNDSPSINVQHTSLQGTIQATRAELTKVFGEPEYFPGGDDVHFHWEIQFTDGTVATIYDWNSKTAPNLYEHMTWNIGGHVQAAVMAVHDAFREAHGLKARAA